MTRRTLRAVTRLIRAWTRLYTAGLPTLVRDRRRAEIESDIWEFTREQTGAGAPLHLLVRFMRGVYDDLAWRQTSVRDAWPRRLAVGVLTAAALLTVALFLSLGRPAVLPQPVPLHAASAPPSPPPPPPPPCPPGARRTSPSSCSP